MYSLIANGGVGQEGCLKYILKLYSFSKIVVVAVILFNQFVWLAAK